MLALIYVAALSFAPRKPASTELEVDWSLVAACIAGGLLLVAMGAVVFLALRQAQAVAEQKRLQELLARNEAERQRMAAEIQRLSPYQKVIDAEATAAQIRGQAEAMATQLRAQTEATAAQLRAQTEAWTGETRTRAQPEAERLTRGARQEADRIVTEANRRAQEIAGKTIDEGAWVQQQIKADLAATPPPSAARELVEADAWGCRGRGATRYERYATVTPRRSPRQPPRWRGAPRASPSDPDPG